jgi:hypothetical protein
MISKGTKEDFEGDQGGLGGLDVLTGKRRKRQHLGVTQRYLQRFGMELP